VLPEDHPDILRLQTAIEMVSYHGVTADAAEPQTDPSYAAVAAMDSIQEHDPFDQQEAALEHHMHALEDMMAAPEFGPDPLLSTEMPAEPAMGLEATLDEPAPAEGYGEDSMLEQLVEQEDTFSVTAPALTADMMPEAMGPHVGAPGVAEHVGFEAMTPEDEINQAMDAVVAQPLQEMEPEPDPFAAAQQIFEEQMQYMHNPFMMPGMGPMPGPAPGM